jgi:hypothetical protein
MVLVQPMQRRGSGNRHNPRCLGQRPRQRNLSRPGIPDPPQIKILAAVLRHKLPDGSRVKSTPGVGGLHHQYPLERGAAETTDRIFAHLTRCDVFAGFVDRVKSSCSPITCRLNSP